MKIKLSTLFIVVLSFALGAGFMRWWDMTQTQKDLAQMQAIFNAQQPADSILTADLRTAELADGVAEENGENDVPQSGTDLPSQLSPIQLEGISEVYGYKKPEPEEQDFSQTAKKSGGVVDLSGAENNVPAATDNARQAMSSNITMIEAPVKARIIETNEQYKEFKRSARGSYPMADFETEQVLVLESQSNLPDKVFEIAGIEPAGDKMVVLYRVNVFGLDKKTNTHSAVKMDKTDLPIVLEQVL